MMAVWFLCVSLLLLAGRNLAGGSSSLLPAGSRDCGTISLSQSPGGAFRGRRQAVTRRDPLFCDALEFYASKGCISSHGAEWGEIMRKYCSADSELPTSLPVDVPQPRVSGRKLLFRALTNASLSAELNSGGNVDGGQENCCGGATFFGVEKVAIAIPTAFLFCCALLCPCFRSKVKEPSEQPVLELNSMDSVSSSSFQRSTGFDRAPGTPLRTPPSPLRVPPSPPRFSLSPRTSTGGGVQLNFNQILKATHNFSESHIIGNGEYGDIYRADLPDGRVVSVKRARKEHFETLRTEFSAEVHLLSKIDHRNLVKLLGYVDKGSERIIVTEYVPNGTLREHLDGLHGKILDFSQRLEIAIDVAHGLTYLHLYAEKPIIHRDVKSSNILLNESFRAKVTNFGFARIGPTEDDKSHVLTKVKGTAGYLDPEYLKTRQLTPKSDVFSFGILLLEILSGRRPVEMKRDANERITIRWAFKKYTHGQMRDILDPLLKEAVHGEVLIKMLSLAFECAAPTRADRPLMKQVGEKLWEIRKEYGNSFTRE